LLVIYMRLSVLLGLEVFGFWYRYNKKYDGQEYWGFLFILLSAIYNCHKYFMVWLWIVDIGYGEVDDMN
jgi:hypothetical protein